MVLMFANNVPFLRPACSRLQNLLAIRGFSEATVTKVQVAAAKVDTSGSSGMFQTGLQCRLARQKVIKASVSFSM